MIAQGAPLVWHDAIDSTNDEATRRARAGDVGPLWIEAGLQTAGRGRRGRAWLSEPGNVFMTYLGATTRAPAQVALLGFATAVAIAEVIDELANKPLARVKWPNDVLIDGAKVCGILLESGSLDVGIAGAGRAWFALGVGVNVASAPDDLDYPIASLASAGVAIDAAGLRKRLRTAIADAAMTLEADGFAPLQQRWTARAHGLGSTVRARIGAEEVVGRAVGLQADGALAIALLDGSIRSISAGEVYFS